MNRFVLAAALACATLSAGQAGAAGTISVKSGTRGVAISTNGPVAQTFVATDALLTNFGFEFVSNLTGATTGSITFSLLSGAGTTGTAIASQTTALSGLVFSRTGGTLYTVFSGSAALTAGQTYTALLSGASSNVSLVFGPNSGSTADAYAPGYLIKNNSLDLACANNSYCDANFSFTTAAGATAVPEMGTWAMLLVGVGSVGAALRRRRAYGAMPARG